ncbi:MAG: hypothetical protein WCT39_04555 [Candidatus Margulisiibacteriota bacterium]
MMGGGMLWCGLLGLFMLLGFAYIVMAFANKESGMIKVAGQVLAAAIAIIAIIMLLQCGMTKRCPMTGRAMMQGKDGEKMMMEMMKKHPDMQKKMMEKMGK